MPTLLEDYRLGRVHFVGGVSHGSFTMERPTCPTMIVPDPCGSGGQYIYTLRRCRDSAGELVEVLAPAGQEIDGKWLLNNGLRN